MPCRQGLAIAVAALATLVLAHGPHEPHLASRAPSGRRLQDEQDREAIHSGERGEIRSAERDQIRRIRPRRGRNRRRGKSRGKGCGRRGRGCLDLPPTEADGTEDEAPVRAPAPPESTVGGAFGSQFETELRALGGLRSTAGAWVDGQRVWVDCGFRLAASCGACGAAAAFGQGRSECGGECWWNATDTRGMAQGTCVPQHAPDAPGSAAALAGAPRPLGFGAQRHELGGGAPRPLWVLAPSLAGAAGLSVALMASPVAAAAGGCRPTGDARFCAGEAPPASAHALLRSGARADAPCACAAAGGGAAAAPWLLSPLSARAAEAEAALRAGAPPPLRLALLREPGALLRHEQLAMPAEACAQLARGSEGWCEADTLAAAAAGPLEERLAVLGACCANLQARTLVASLPAGVPGRDACARGARAGCDDTRLLALARRALLGLGFFGLAERPAATAALLRATLGARALPADGLGAPPQLPGMRGWALRPEQRREWQRANRVDLELLDAAVGVFEYRLRAAGLRVPPAAVVEAEYDVGEQLRLSRRFATSKGDGAPAALVPWPRPFRRRHESLVFVHIAKCGGTSFNKRLTMLDVGPACRCGLIKKKPLYHNGHALVEPKSCHCPRRARAEPPAVQWAAVQQRIPGARGDWAFLQQQWLISPDTTGWLGGVHSPVRVLQQYVMLAAKLAARPSLAAGLHYVTIVRDPLKRFLSEFYETYNGWEVKFRSWPRVPKPCSSLLPGHKRQLALDGIDHTSKRLYDTLFDDWIHCPFNMASDRQSRTLSFTVDVNATAQMRQRICGPSLPHGDPEVLCSGRIARRTLLQFSFFGLLEQRCLSEKLFEAQFGLQFNRTAVGGRARVSTHTGKGAHRVTKLSFDDLTPAQQQRVRWLNRNDLLLYEEAVRIFYERLRLYGISPDAQCT